MPKSHCRIDGMIAREANVAVIFRRGPSDATQMLVWDLNTDEVTPGQWLKGTVYTRNCDVSPDGRYAVIKATNFAKEFHTRKNQNNEPYSAGWTAVCRPPYFTAIALWLTGDAWAGGGYWQNSRELFVYNNRHQWDERLKPDPSIRVVKLNPERPDDWTVYAKKLARDGWHLVQDEQWGVVMPFTMLHRDLRLTPRWLPGFVCKQSGVVEKQVGGCLLRGTSDGNGMRFQLISEHNEVAREWSAEYRHPLWVDVDARGRIVFGDQGCLWAWDGFPTGEPRLIADLNKNKFEAVPPPDWARQW